MPSAYGHANGHHLVNTNSMAALTNGQTPSSISSSSTVSPHRHAGGSVGGSHSHQSAQTIRTSHSTASNEEVGIKEVWAHNLEEEFIEIRKIVQHYPYVAMDTEFPGVVARPIGTFISNSEYLYQIMRSNITMLKIIQIGLTFMNSEGKKPDTYSTWQFNFRFSLNEDMFAQESIDLLISSGIKFEKHEKDGIDPTEFAVLLIGSGVVLSDNISWLSFHSGYDFGYLLSILTDQQLPKREGEFFELLKIYFPRVYDLKYLMKSTKDLKGGLQEVAEQLTLVRKGPQHQAGSDSLLTGETFFKLKEMYFENDIEEKRYSGFIYGLEAAEIGKQETDDDNSSVTTTSSTTTSGTSLVYIPNARNVNNNNNNNLNQSSSSSSNNNSNTNGANTTSANNSGSGSENISSSGGNDDPGTNESNGANNNNGSSGSSSILAANTPSTVSASTS